MGDGEWYNPEQFAHPDQLWCRCLISTGRVCGSKADQMFDFTPVCNRHFERLSHDAINHLSWWISRCSTLERARTWDPDNRAGWSLRDVTELGESIREALVMWGWWKDYPRRLTDEERHPKPKKAKRRQISQRTRFAVLERDGFCCHYCGRAAPNVELHVDHIIPVSAGGVDDMSNYIASCADCNLGKHSRLLWESSGV